jgi:hypothetical protein
MVRALMSIRVLPHALQPARPVATRLGGDTLDPRHNGLAPRRRPALVTLRCRSRSLVGRDPPSFWTAIKVIQLAA